MIAHGVMILIRSIYIHIHKSPSSVNLPLSCNIPISQVPVLSHRPPATILPYEFLMQAELDPQPDLANKGLAS